MADAAIPPESPRFVVVESHFLPGAWRVYDAAVHRVIFRDTESVCRAYAESLRRYTTNPEKPS